MILIDKPFASDFLIKTIKENNYPIIATETAKKMIQDESLNWISESAANEKFNTQANLPVYTNSENSISWIEKNFKISVLPAQIQLFKNKITFREFIKDAFPNYYFKGVKVDALRDINTTTLKFPFIIKPAVGFFSLAVHKVDNLSEWNLILDIIESEIRDCKGMYPAEVVDTSQFIIEEFIEGEEYAIDCYFNNEGIPVVLNILHHIFSSDKDVSDRVYTTSKAIIEKHKPEIEDFLSFIGSKAHLRNFPMHLEVRIDKNKKVCPIEINPLRFGGWCTTGDISWYAYGINSYEYFFKNKTPNWDDLLKSKKNKLYCLIVLDNNSGIKENEIASFDYDLLLKDFEKPLNLRKVDFKTYAVFGFLFTETTLDNKEELNHILTSDLRKYIKLKNNIVHNLTMIN
jgi:hypothetical protein